MTLGWRGVMTKYSGFYDLPTAWNQVFWGILLGGAFASYADSSLFLPYYEAWLTERTPRTECNTSPSCSFNRNHRYAFLIATQAGPERRFTSNERLGIGLAVGGMLSIVLITRKVQSGIDGVADAATIVLIGFFAPRVEAVITAFHGTLMLREKRWGLFSERPWASLPH